MSRVQKRCSSLASAFAPAQNSGEPDCGHLSGCSPRRRLDGFGSRQETTCFCGRSRGSRKRSGTNAPGVCLAGVAVSTRWLLGVPTEEGKGCVGRTCDRSQSHEGSEGGKVTSFQPDLCRGCGVRCTKLAGACQKWSGEGAKRTEVEGAWGDCRRVRCCAFGVGIMRLQE